MRHLIIPDVHDKVDLAQRIIDHEPHDARVFLGDFFDDWGTGPRQAAVTARKLRQWLREPDTTIILGNHDQSYGWGEDNSIHLCSGYTKSKWKAIHAEMSRDDWHSFKLHAWVPGEARPWLLTHAGFDAHFLPDGFPLETTVDSRCGAALRSLKDPIPFNRGVDQALLMAGHDRGGDRIRGGVTWCGWETLEPPAGANQLIGHTQGVDVREKKRVGSRAICLDTRLNHYAIIEDGELSVHPISKIPVRG